MKKTKAVSVDVIVFHMGTLTMMEPQTPHAESWMKANLAHAEGQKWGVAYAIEPRYVNHIVDGMTADGLTVG